MKTNQITITNKIPGFTIGASVGAILTLVLCFGLVLEFRREKKSAEGSLEGEKRHHALTSEALEVARASVKHWRDAYDDRIYELGRLKSKLEGAAVLTNSTGNMTVYYRSGPN